MRKGSTTKQDKTPASEDTVDLSTLSVAKGWLTLQKYSLTRGTRILVTSTIILVVVGVLATIAFLSLGWRHDSRKLNEAQDTISSQRGQISQLEDNYSALYSEYIGSTHEVPNAPSPSDADTADTLSCPTGTVLKEFTVETDSDGTQTFVACQVTKH